jgi:hypothetical protein
VLSDQRRRRAARRVRPGDGRPLKPFRWWQSLSRALFYLPLTGDDGRSTVYAVDVRHWGNQSSGEVQAHLYLDGRQHAVSKIPAAFPVQGGTIEVAASAFGLKRCHYVTAPGVERQLVPDRDSAEGRRATFDRLQPALSRAIGVLSLILLGIGLLIFIPQLLASITLIPPIAEHVGTFVSPIQLPGWLNVSIGIVVAAASTERALRLRYNVLLDGGAG